MNDVPNEKLKVIVELDQNNFRVSFEGPCDVDKWRAANVRYWRRKIKNKRWKSDTRLSLD
jgi:hypothetical protein